MSTNSYIQLEDIYKSFREGNQDRLILHGINASFPKGEFAAILGKSGSGKSTLLNLISGIDVADSGKIIFNNVDLSSMGDRQRTLFRRDCIGFIFQFFNLIPTLSVIENVLLPAELSGKPRLQATLTAEGLLELVGLSGRRDSFPDRLSGGEQQRVAIARALINDPILLLADEPTGNLDEATGKTVLSLLDRLTRQAGKNLILVTHNPDAALLADRVLLLNDGKLVEQ